MTSDGDEDGGRNRRQFLKATGSVAAVGALAGCDQAPDDGETGSDGGDGDQGDDGRTVDPESLTADPYAVETAAIGEGDDLAASTFAEEYYTRLEGGVAGIAAGDAGPTPVGHAVTYGHEMAGPNEEAGPSTLRPLSAGVLSLPAPREGSINALVDAPLAEVVGRGENNVLLAAAGLGRSVELLGDPVPIDGDEASGEVQMELDGSQVAAEMRTYVVAVRAEPGPGMPTAESAGYFDRSAAGPQQFLATVHAGRAHVGGDLLLVGMVGGWERPPTMGPRPVEMDVDTKELLADLYQDAVRVGLFRSVLGDATTLAANLLPGEEELEQRRADEQYVQESSEGWFGMSDIGQVELGYPDEETHENTVSTSFTVGRDVPELLSETEFDPDEHSAGTEYLVEADTELASYPLDDEHTVPFGVIASPTVEIEGEERNPLATESLSELLTFSDGLWNLTRHAADLGDFDWRTGPTEIDRISGLGMVGHSGDFRRYDGTIEKADGSTADVTVFAGRVVTEMGTVLALAFGETDGSGGHFRTASSVERLFTEGVNKVRYEPETPDDWVDASIDDLDLVQIVSDTRLEKSGGDVLEQPDPDLVEERYTAPTFDVTTFDGSPLSQYDHKYGVFTFDVANRSDDFQMVLDEWALSAIDEGTSEPDGVFDEQTHDGDADDLPVFELRDTDTSVTLEHQAPSGYRYDTHTIREGSDYSITGLDVLRIGVVAVHDPDRGDNYGGSNGFPEKYDDTVEAGFEFVRRTFPTGVAMYSHDLVLRGNEKEYVDYDQARIVLEEIADPNNSNRRFTGDFHTHRISESAARKDIQNDGFDVWVLIVPDDYYVYHNDTSTPAGLAPGDDRLAVTTADGDRIGRAFAGEVVAQEIGHRLKDNPYENPSSGDGESNPLAQRDDDGTNAGNRDFDHARHASSFNDRSASRDQPGVLSRAFSLVEGEFRVPTIHTWDGGYQLSRFATRPKPEGYYGPNLERERVGRMESYMSYSRRTTWADSVITNDILDGDLNRDSGTIRDYKLVSAGEDDGDDDGESASGVTLEDVWVTEGFAAETDPERLEEAASTVDVSLFGPDGEVVAETRTTAGVPVAGHEVEDEDLDGAVVFDVEFHPDAVEVLVERDGVPTTINPVTRPVRDAYDRLPDEGIAGDPAPVRDRIATVLSAVDEAMAAGEFGRARDELATYAETELPEVVDPEFLPAPNQPDRDRLASLFDHLIVRLDRLAGDDGGEVRSGDPPGWADWIPVPSALPVFGETHALWQYTVSGVLESDGGDFGVPDDDPMANPAVAALAATFSWTELDGVGVSEPVLGAAVEETDVDPAEVPADTGLIVGDTHVYLGSFDVGALDEAVAANDFAETEAAGIYRHGSADLVIAYGESYVLAGGTVAAVETLRATGAGDIERWTDRSEAVAWLLGAGAVGDFTLAAHRADGGITDETDDTLDLSPFVGSTGLAQSLSVDGAAATGGTAAMVYPDEESAADHPDEVLGPTADDRSAARDGRYVTVRVSYDGALDG